MKSKRKLKYNICIFNSLLNTKIAPGTEREQDDEESWLIATDLQLVFARISVQELHDGVFDEAEHIIERVLYHKYKTN